MTALYSERVGEALKLAADSFAREIRKGTDGRGQTPIIYLSHLLQVSAWVAEHRGTEDQIIAAVLHDYLEDIDGASEDALREQFGGTVASYVPALSDTTVQPKPPWKPRKEAYLSRLAAESADVKLISVCDKLHNASRILVDFLDIGNAVFDRFSATREETLWYYREVAFSLGDGWEHPALEDLKSTVDELHRAVEQRG